MSFDIDKLSIEELEHQSRELEVERIKAKAERDKAQTHYLTVSEEKDLIDRILEFKRNRLKENADTSPVSEVVNEVDKTAAILEAVRRGGAKGVYPKEVEAALRDSGIELKDGYVHAILSRLKKRGEVFTQGKRYFRTESITANSNP
jgi:hypothetical protein